MKKTAKRFLALSVILIITMSSLALTAGASGKQMDGEVTVYLYQHGDITTPSDKYNEKIDGSSPLDSEGKQENKAELTKAESEIVDYIIEEKGKLPATGSNNLLAVVLATISVVFMIAYQSSENKLEPATRKNDK